MRLSSKTQSNAEWITRYCAIYLLNKLYESHGLPNKHQYNINSVCFDRRRTSTAFKVLTQAGVTTGAWSGVPSFVPEKILEVAPQYAKAPVFSTEAVKKSYQGELLIDNQYKAYRDIEDFLPEEALYVCIHQDEYEIDKHERVIPDSARTWSVPTKIYELRIYPKAQLDDLNVSIFNAKLDNFLRTHIEFTLEHGLGVERTALDSDTRDFGHYDDNFRHFDWTSKDLDQRLNVARATIDRAKQAEESLLVLQKKADEVGGYPELKHTLHKNLKVYLSQNAPLYINSKDAALKDLVTMLLKMPCLHQ